jgi:flagellar operon protein
LAARDIKLTPGQIATLEQAVDRLQAKGGRESLVILGDVAFVVSVKNRTVITAVDSESMKENVFTNIDSAIVN